MAEMEFATSIGWFSKAFHILGLAPCFEESTAAKMGFFNRVGKTVPVLIQTGIAFYLGITCIVELGSGQNDKYSRSDLIFYSLFMLCEMARSSCILLQCIFYKHIIYDVINTFRKLESLFVVHLRYRIVYLGFKKKYMIKVITVMLFYFLYISAFAVRVFLYPNYSPAIIQIKLLQALTSFTFLHIIFYIDLLSFNLHELSAVIQKDMIGNNDHNLNNVVFFCKKPVTNVVIRNKIKCYKNIHFRLWEATQRVNCYFGWCMVAMLLHSFVDIVYCSYWLVGQLHKSVTFLEIFRKYCDEFRIEFAY